MTPQMSWRRSLSVLVLSLATLGAAAPARPPAKPSTPALAPADRYFGRMKMSPIGIRMQIGILSRNYTWRTMSDDQILHDAEFVRDALDDWRVKFPKDPWLAPTSLHLAQLYTQ